VDRRHGRGPGDCLGGVFAWRRKGGKGGGSAATDSLYSHGAGKDEGVLGSGLECHAVEGSGWVVLATAAGRCPDAQHERMPIQNREKGGVDRWARGYSAQV
jgi:hypothetical protein